MKVILLALISTLAISARADVFMGELKKTKCTTVKGKEFMKYVKDALGDGKLEVVYDESGTCGKSAYLMKKSTRRRWAVFPTQKGCQCYLNTLKAIDSAK